MKKPKDVNEYIASAPEELRSVLSQLRSVIKDAAPGAKERISYGMPYYEYKGRLAYFGAFKEHISLFVIPPVIAEHAKELKNYVTTKSAVHFPLDEPLPAELIKKLVRARVRKNDAGLGKFADKR